MKDNQAVKRPSIKPFFMAAGALTATTIAILSTTGSKMLAGVAAVSVFVATLKEAERREKSAGRTPETDSGHMKQAFLAAAAGIGTGLLTTYVTGFPLAGQLTAVVATALSKRKMEAEQLFMPLQVKP